MIFYYRDWLLYNTIDIRHLENFIGGNRLKTVDGSIDWVKYSHIGLIWQLSETKFLSIQYSIWKNDANGLSHLSLTKILSTRKLCLLFVFLCVTKAKWKIKLADIERTGHSILHVLLRMSKLSLKNTNITFSIQYYVSGN